MLLPDAIEPFSSLGCYLCTHTSHGLSTMLLPGNNKNLFDVTLIILMRAIRPMAVGRRPTMIDMAVGDFTSKTVRRHLPRSMVSPEVTSLPVRK
jgi:hypothetical protein